MMRIHEAVETAVDLLGSAGGVVVGDVSSQRNLRWANSALTTNGDMTDQTLAVAAFEHTNDGVCNGLAMGQFRDRSDIEALVAKARASARAAGPSPDAAQLPDGIAHADFSLAPAEGGALDHIASGLREVLRDPGAQYFGYAQESIDTSYVATSAGLRLRVVDETARFELCAKDAARTQSAWSGQGGSTLSAVDIAHHARTVREGLAHQARKIDLEPGQHDVTLSPSAFADLLIYMLWHATAREANEGRSVFSNPLGGTRIGQSLTQRNLTVATDPTVAGIETHDTVVNLATTSGGSPFDTGLHVPRTEVISQGRLAALASNRHEAAVASLPFTALADNIDVRDAHGSGSLAEVAARLGDGLLITCLWYIREVDPQSLLLTGLTRDGVYVVRGGEIVGAANNFRFNESPVSLLSRITDAGDPTLCLPREWADWFSRAKVCPVTVSGFNLSTRSDAV